MKTKNTIKYILLALAIGISFASCKNDKKADPAPPPAQAITFDALKKLSTGTSVKIPDNTKITGTVISDISNKNIDPKTIVLQEATGKPGIVVTFDAAQTFATGDQVDVIISNQTLAQVNGEITLSDIPSANAKKTGAGTITPAITNTVNVIKNAAAFDGTLVTVPASGLNGGSGNYSGILTITDSTGTISSAILPGAVFENTAYPTLVQSITGIVRISGATARLDIRKAIDVKSAISRSITEDFTNLTTIFPLPEVSEDFTTAASAWFLYMNGAYLPGATNDAAFTTPGRSYLYIGYSDVHGLAYGTLRSSATNLSGLKTVTVTFAASEMHGNVYPISNVNIVYQDVQAFNSATDTTKIGICPGILDLVTTNTDINSTYADYQQNLQRLTQKLTTLSPAYNKAGVFYTVTAILPTRAQLIADGIVSSVVDSWLQNPSFTIYNFSSRRVKGGAVYDPTMAPILLDKVVLGF